jgi:hypothetical protein
MRTLEAARYAKAREIPQCGARRHPFSPHRWNGLIISQFRVQLDIHWTSQLGFGHGNWEPTLSAERKSRVIFLSGR